jgi:hypothetical protein
MFKMATGNTGNTFGIDVGGNVFVQSNTVCLLNCHTISNNEFHCVCCCPQLLTVVYAKQWNLTVVASQPAIVELAM